MSWKLSWHHTKIYRIKKQVDWVLCLYSDWKCFNEGFALFHLLFLLHFPSGFEEMSLIWSPGSCVCQLIITFQYNTDKP